METRPQSPCHLRQRSMIVGNRVDLSDSHLYTPV